MMPRHLARKTVYAVLCKSDEPATTRDISTAAYFFSGDDRMGYAAVRNALHQLAADNLAVQRDGRWSAS